MSDGKDESEIRYRLVKVTSAKAKSGAYTYRAVTKHDPIDMEHLAKTKDPLLTAHIGSNQPMLAVQDAYRVLGAMIEGVFRDGRTRRLGNFLEIRGDIRGSFENDSEAFDPAKHTFALNVRLLNEATAYAKRVTNPKLEKDKPASNAKSPRGKSAK